MSRACRRLPFLACILSVSGVLFCQQHDPPYPRIDNTAGYRVDPEWPRDAPPGGAWDAAMSGIAIGPDGNVWTLNRGTIPVQVYSADGRLVRTWGEGVFQNAHTVRFDPDGNLWIIDTLSHTVREFSTGGEVLMTIGTLGEAGRDATHLNQPNDVAFGPDGSLYVSDGYGNDRVVVFDRNGTFLRSWGKLGSGPGEFSQPHSIAVDSQGRVYVADRNNARIQVFDSEGRFLDEWKNLITPWYLVITPDDAIYVCGSSPMLWSDVPESQAALATPPKDQLVMRLDPDGRVRQLWTFPKGELGQERPGELNWVHTMDVDPDGVLYMGDVQGRRAQKFVPAGADGDF